MLANARSTHIRTQVPDFVPADVLFLIITAKI
jgi:hypothetical protein